MPPVTVRIAGAVLQLEPASRDVELGLSEPMRDFVCGPAPADMRFTVARADLSAPRGGELLFDSGALWRLYRDGAHLELRMTTPVLGEVPYKIARFDAELAHGSIQIHSGYPTYFPASGPLDPLEYPLGELLWLHWLGQGRGIEVHSCGMVDDNGDGYLLVGHSGAGKTTSAELWLERGGVEVLSDDRVILRKERGAIWMYGTPWHGTAVLSSPRAAPVRGILFLKQAQHNRIVPMRRSMIASRLLACSFVPLYRREALAYSMEFLEEVASSVFCGELEFTRDPTVADFVRRELSHPPHRQAAARG